MTRHPPPKHRTYLWYAAHKTQETHCFLVYTWANFRTYTLANDVHLCKKLHFKNVQTYRGETQGDMYMSCQDMGHFDKACSERNTLVPRPRHKVKAKHSITLKLSHQDQTAKYRLRVRVRHRYRN